MMISTIRPGIRAIKRISDEKVFTETGKSWDDWVEAINLQNGNSEELLAIIEYLMGTYGLTHLWAATIASYYLMAQSGEYSNS